MRNSLLAITSANGNWKEFANEHGIKVATAYRWINARASNYDSWGGHRGSRISEDHLNFLESQIERNPRVTLKENAAMFNQAYATNLSRETIRRSLNGLTYTLKEVKIQYFFTVMVI